LTDTLHILFEDNHIIAVNKTVSDLVQKDNTGDPALDDKVKKYIREKYNKPGELSWALYRKPSVSEVCFARTGKRRLNNVQRRPSPKPGLL
jgi:23S rRNA pseudouridine1911/1915/1917 synthase